MEDQIVGLKLQVDGSGAEKSVGNIRKEIKEATAELIKAQEAFGDYSQEAVNAAKRVAELKDKVSEAAETADLFDPGKKFQAFAGALNAVAGGFAAVQGALGLIGVESEEVEKQLLKVQSALALSQGLSTIVDSAKDFRRLAVVLQGFAPIQQANAVANRLAAATMTLFGASVNTTSVAFRVLKGAIAATGIGLLVVALGSVVEAFTSFESAAKRAAQSQKDFNDQAQKLADVGLKAELAFIERNTKLRASEAKARGESAEEIRKIEEGALDLRRSAYQRFYERSGKDTTEAGIAAKQQIDDLNADIIIRENNAAGDRLNAERSAAEKRLEANKSEGERRSAELKAQRERDRAEREKQEDIDRQKELDRRKQIADAQKLLIDAQRDILLKSIEDDRQRELQQLEFTFEEQRNAAFNNFEALLIIDETFRIRQQEINDKYDKEADEKAIQRGVDQIARLKAQTDAKRENDLAQIQIDAAKTDALIAGAQQVSALIGGLGQLFQKQTAAAKIAGVAQATIDTYASVATVFRQASLNPATVPFPAYPYLQAGAALVSGIARVKAIVAVPVPGGGGGSAVPSGLQGGGGAAPIAPSAQVGTTQLAQATINQLQNANTRAYVVESDITGAQSRVTRLNRAARLG
jgi:hypothetical protein